MRERERARENHIFSGVCGEMSLMMKLFLFDPVTAESSK